MPAPSGAPKKSSKKGCIIALVVVAIFGLMGMIGLGVAAVFVGNAVDDAVEDGGLPGLAGGDCAKFQFAYLSLTFTGILGAGADEAQQQQLESQLGQLESLAPSEIKGDMAIVAAAFRESISTATGGQGLVGGAEESDERNREAEAVLERPEVKEAQENINRWVEDNCAYGFGLFGIGDDAKAQWGGIAVLALGLAPCRGDACCVPGFVRGSVAVEARDPFGAVADDRTLRRADPQVPHDPPSNVTRHDLGDHASVVVACVRLW